MDCPDKVVLREIRPGDNVSGFSLGLAEYKELKFFLQRDAKQFHEENIARTYVLVNPDDADSHVIGFISLICSEIVCKGGNATTSCLRADKYETMPGVKIARLAVHKDCFGMGFGTDLFRWTIAEVTSNIMPRVGCRFLIVDSKPKAVPWYEKMGFTLLNTEKNRNSTHPVLFIDLHKLE